MSRRAIRQIDLLWDGCRLSLTKGVFGAHVLRDEVQKAGRDASIAERRHCHRRLISGAALIPVDVEPDGSFALLVDLSEEGAAIQAVTPIDAGTDKILRWRFPGEETPTEVGATIVWSNANNLVGVRFTQTSEETRARIAEWVEGIANSRDFVPDDFGSCAANDPASSVSAGTDAVADGVPNDTLWLDLQLSLLAGQVRSELAADGVAVAVACDDTFVCRASVGSAPDVGAVLLGDAGLSAECIRTGQVVCCLDSGTDSRVDASVCDAMHLGSAVVLPIKRGAKVYALLEAFWARPNSFDDSVLSELCGFAVRLVSLLESEESLPAASASESDLPAHPTSRSVAASDLQDLPGLRKSSLPVGAATVSDTELVERIVRAVRNDALDGVTPALIPGRGNGKTDRLLLVATAMLAIMAVFAGVLAWYASRQAKSAATAASGAAAQSGEDVPISESSSVPLPEVASTGRDATSTAPSVAGHGGGMMSMPVITDVKLASAPVPGSSATSAPLSSSKRRPSTGDRRRTVLLDVTMDQQGKITDVRVVSGDPKLAKLAKEAVTSNRYPINNGINTSPNARIIVSFGPKD